MAYAVCLRALERCCLALLMVSAAGSSMASECNVFDLRSTNNGGNWRCISFEDSTDCFMCVLRMGKNKEPAEFVLPCSDPSQSSVKRQLQISYVVGQGTSGSKDMDSSPLSFKEEAGKNCRDEYFSAAPLKKDCMQSSGEQLQRSHFQSGMVEIFDINSAMSYRLKVELDKVFIVCFTSMEFKQTQSSFPIWVIVLIISIVVIGIFAVVGIFIRQRKHHDHKPDNNDNTETSGGHSNQMKENTKSDKDVILNPTYGQDPDSEKDEEYHSYTEIDVKEPANSDMIYNSAYESQSPNNGMIYNSAYECQPPSNDMIYNSTYESSTSN